MADRFNPLRIQAPADMSANPLSRGPDLAGAASSTWDAATQWLAAQRAKSAAMGLMDPATGMPTQAGWTQAGNAFAGGMGDNPLSGGGMLGSIKAYHGSPHSFDRFDMGAIGTGEGAQAYGHGLYFAGNEKVAQSYRDSLKWKGTDWNDPGYVAGYWLQHHKGDADAAASYLEGSLKHQSTPEAQNAVSGAIDLLKSGGGTAGSANPGSMYEVNLAADPEHMLDWDKPLSEQPQHVQDAVNGLGVPLPERQMSEADLAPHKAAITDAFQGTSLQGMGRSIADDLVYGRKQWDVDSLRKHIASENPQRGQALDAAIANARTAAAPQGSGIYGALSSHLESDPAAAADALRSAGIPGIKYLDAGSRSAGEGSHNYVMFDDNLINILRKYGIAGLGIGVGAGAAGTGSQDTQ
jgi:hypothetical protein